MRQDPFLRRMLRAPRHALRARCHIVRLRDLRIVADELENFSTHGLLVGPSDAVLTGEPVLIFMRFPETDDWLDATGTVARVLHGRRPGEWTRSLGIELDDDADARAVLLHNLGRRPPAPPKVRPGRRLFSPGAIARLSPVAPLHAG